MEDTEKLILTTKESEDIFAVVVEKLKAADGTGGPQLFSPTASN
jgi:hypothetical protein